MISLIVAHDSMLGIGKNGKMPWSIPDELENFKYLTIGKPIIMGRKTYESIGKELKGRLNIVITSDEEYEAPEGVLIVSSIEEAFDNLLFVGYEDEVMIIGGGEIYNSAINYADRIYATQIHQTFECDTFFPEYAENFTEIFRSTVKYYSKDSLSYEYTVYKKKD